MNKKLRYTVGFILAVLTVVYGACKQPGGSNPGDNPYTYAYTVTFDENHYDAEGWTEANPHTMIVTEPATTVGNLPASPTRQGWIFTGWNTARDGTGASFDGNTAVTADIIVYAQWAGAGSSNGLFAVALNISGKVDGDSVALSSSSGKAGDTVTISYTVVAPETNNRLAFSGVISTAIAQVQVEKDNPESGTRQYVIDEKDAVNGTITINAVFTHTNLLLDTIAFADEQEIKTYGDGIFTKGLANAGIGGGNVSYSSVNHAVATVNETNGEVTIHGVGTSMITAVKESDGTYEGTQASYILNVERLLLTISDPDVTPTRAYVAGNTGAAVIAGALTNQVGSDEVTVSATATYNSANVAEANQITVVYAIDGADAGKYIEPINYTTGGTITKADGFEVASPPTAASKTSASVTLTQVILSGNSTVQTVEYARAENTTVPTAGWQDGRTFNGLQSNTDYYFFARSKVSDNYNAGTPKTSAAIRTENEVFSVTLKISGNGNGDSVTRSPDSGVAGATVTITYNLAPLSDNNQLVFSGVNSVIGPVTASGSDKWNYVINEGDAVDGAITINAVFTHTDLKLNAIAFTNIHENKTYGDFAFTNALTNSGLGSGTLSYSSSDTAVATVTNSGAVTILKNGTATITATKAADGEYAGTTASYALNVAQRQLIIANPTVAPKTYDGNTSATVTAGDLNNKVGTDIVNVSAAANYNSADAGTGKTITVVYTITGADAGKYIKPVDYTVNTGTITKANGTEMGSTNPITATTTQTSVNLTARLTGDSTVQTIEYARALAATPVPTTGWQDNASFTGLTPDTQYYFFARSKENANYNAGEAKNLAVRTNGLAANTIAFTAETGSRQYGDTFTKTISSSGSGSGAETYSSGNTAVATVNSSTGAVNIVGFSGTAVITATKASDGTYAAATATYTITATQRQLTIANPTLTASKSYDGNTSAAVIAGALSGRVGSDAVTVTAAANYNTADAGANKQITVVYTIAGNDANKYIKPVYYTVNNGTITKASGSAVSAPTAANTASTSITLNASTLTIATGQTIEYARASNTTVPTTGWQTSTSFSGLTANTSHNFWARSQSNINYNTGTESARVAISTAAAGTPSVPPTVIDFESDNTGKTYSSTKGGSSPTVSVIADPATTGQKSLSISANGYNQAAIIPVNLPYELQNYATISFRINIRTGTGLTDNTVMIYAAGNASTFLDHGFGNPANSQYPQFAGNLIAETPVTDFTSSTYANQWAPFTITLSPGSATGGLKGNIFIAIGINSDKTVTYLLDDITFTIKDSFVSPDPLPVPEPPSIGAVSSGNYRNLFKEFGKTDTEINAKVQDTWNKLFTSSGETNRIYYTVGSDMAYILDSGNSDVRSEGMSYGMMMAVQMDEKAVFDRLWKWARTYMYNAPDKKIDNIRGYFSWKRNTSGTGGDPNPAPDGEFYFVTSLLFASVRWGDGTGIFEYGKEARQILYDMIHRDPGGLDNWGAPSMFRTEDYNGHGKYMPVFSTIGGAANHTDPSYHLPAFYEVWAIELERDADRGNTWGIWPTVQALRDDAAFYKSAATTSRAFFPKTTHQTTGLGPDYAAFDGSPTGSQPYFEYDAWRIAMNIGMDYSWFAADPWQITFANRIQTFFYGKGVNSYKSLWQLNGTPRQNEGDHSPGLVAGNAVASLAATHERAWEFLEDFWNISMTSGQYRYYDGCLYMLGLLHVTGKFKAYLSGGNVTPSATISPTTVTFDKYAPANISVTMTLNENTLSNIQNGGTNLTRNTHYTVSGSTVTLNTSYLNTLPLGTTTLTFVFSAGSQRTLTITVTDTTPSASISPTTAIFDKRSDLRADIPVTMTLNGYTFNRVQNGSTNLTSGTDYTTSGNTVTLKTSYLAGRANGVTTLTFVFNGGSNQDIAITIRETAPGATPGGGGTSLDFSAMSSVTVDPLGTGISATLSGGALRVEKTTGHSTVAIVLTLDLGTKTLGDFTGVRYEIRAVTTGFDYKDVIIEVPNTAGGTFSSFNNNTKLIASHQINLASGSATYTTYEKTFAASAPLTRGGEIQIAFGLNNVPAGTYELRKIELY